MPKGKSGEKTRLHFHELPVPKLRGHRMNWGEGDQFWEILEGRAIKLVLIGLAAGIVYANCRRISGLDRIPKDHLRIKTSGSEIKIYGYTKAQIGDLRSPGRIDVIFCLNCDPPGICVSAIDKKYYSFQGKSCWNEPEKKESKP
ncbi:MAG: hypothetical protein QME66_05855 [Candidatus Eisenbacteria bacterium]|nr:hypothetical protein [Candidatus Eisenbacteria bacterium]